MVHNRGRAQRQGGREGRDFTSVCDEKVCRRGPGRPSGASWCDAAWTGAALRHSSTSKPPEAPIGHWLNRSPGGAEDEEEEGEGVAWGEQVQCMGGVIPHCHLLSLFFFYSGGPAFL